MGYIIAEVCSGSLRKSNMELSIKIIVNLWKSLTCVEKTSIWDIEKTSVIRQKGESQNGCFKKTKHAKFSEKRTFLTPWYAHVREALENNSLQLKAVSFFCKNCVFDTSKYLDLPVGKYDFPITVKGCFPHKRPLNWIRFLLNKKWHFAKYHFNQGGIRDPYHDLRWSLLWQVFEK